MHHETSRRTVIESHNVAAWIDRRGAELSVREADFPTPGADQIVVRNYAVGVNPLDWIIRVAGRFAYGWLKYPAVLGSDIAGVVVEAGSDVTRFTVGDRVLAHVVGTDKDVNAPAEGAFAHYSVALERLSCPLPDSMTFEQAAVLPLAVSTAACGLFQRDFLALPHPSTQPEPTGQTVLVWGGSTSVGSQAIQLAVAAGYDVITTASPHNADYVRSLGASQVFDYHSDTVLDDVVAAVAGHQLAGAIAFGDTSARSCVDIAARCDGRRFVALASPPVSFAPLGDPGTGRIARVALMRRLVSSMVALQVHARRRRVSTKFIYGTTLKSNEVSTAVYRDFLPAALAAGSYRPVPEPLVAGTGLDQVAHALEVQRRGVSARKVVVSLPA